MIPEIKLVKNNKICGILISKKTLPNSRLTKLTPSKSFLVLAFMFRSLIRFSVHFEHGSAEPNLFFFMWTSSCPKPFVEETVLFLLNCLGTLVKNQLTIDNNGFISGLVGSVPLI